MNKPFLAFIVFLTFGLFQMSESVVAENIQPKDNVILLSDSILNVRIDSSKSMSNLQTRLDKVEQSIQLQSVKIEEMPLQGVPSWLLILTIINAIASFCFIFSKIRNVIKSRQNSTKESDGNIAVREVKQNINESSSASSNYKTTNVLSSSANCCNVDRRRNVVVKTYGKNYNSDIVQTSDVKTKEKRKVQLHRFANFMVDNGRISTLERTISDDSRDKLFVIDYKEGAEVATYTINPECKALILSDIQTFQNYVAKFNIVGNPTDVVVKKAGRLNKVGKQWVVTEKLIVEFK